MRHKVDLRGLSCPEPVLRARRLLDDNHIDIVEALVDDQVCVNNLQRLAASVKAQAWVTSQGNFFEVVIARKAPAPGSQNSTSQDSSHSLDSLSPETTATVIFLAKDTFGQGDPEFSQTLLNLFMQTVLEAGHKPRAILMANTGVKLMAAQSPLRKVLQDFKAQGCEVLACGLCLEFYGLKDQVPPEQITNMFAISEYLFAADKVLSP